MKPPKITPGDWQSVRLDFGNDRTKDRFAIRQSPFAALDDPDARATLDVAIVEAENGEANSRSIAALPECLAALHTALEKLMEYAPKEARGHKEGCFKYVVGGADMWGCKCPVCQARAALLKAGYTE